jgi:hypothetical protein
MSTEQPDTNNGNQIQDFMRKLAFPFTLANFVISGCMFFMSTGIALTNSSFTSYVIFLVFFILYYAIMVALFSQKRIIMHTMMYSASIFIFFYNFIPYLYLKNSNKLIINNYVIIISCMFAVFSMLLYFSGYILLFKNCHDNRNRPIDLLPDCTELSDLLKAINPSNEDERKAYVNKLVTSNLIATTFLTFVIAFSAVSIVLGCFGSAYFPNYILFANQDMCSRPTNQTFKCSMYQNGKIITAAL